MGAGWQISAGDIAEVLRPAWFALAALISAWVLRDSLRRPSSQLYEIAIWTLSALILPFVVLPLYLAARLFKRTVHSLDFVHQTANEDAESPSDGVSADTSRDDIATSFEDHAESHADGRRIAVTTTDDETPDVSSPGDEESKPDDSSTGEEESEADFRRAPRLSLRVALPLIYFASLLAAGGLYFYDDDRSFDAQFARVKRAKLNGRPERALRAYRAALAAREDAHTRKLLGLELLEAGRPDEALAEFRAAERQTTDEKLRFHQASALDALGRRDEASALFREFLRSESCAGMQPDELCDLARARARSDGEQTDLR